MFPKYLFLPSLQPRIDKYGQAFSNFMGHLKYVNMQIVIHLEMWSLHRSPVYLCIKLLRKTVKSHFCLKSPLLFSCKDELACLIFRKLYNPCLTYCFLFFFLLRYVGNFPRSCWQMWTEDEWENLNFECYRMRSR